MTVALRSIFARYRRRSATFMNDFKWDIKKRSTKGMNGGRFLYYSKRQCFFFFPFLQRSSLVILFSSLQEYVMHCWQQKLPWMKHQLISTYILNVLSLKSLQYIQKSTSIGFADLHLKCFSKRQFTMFENRNKSFTWIFIGLWIFCQKIRQIEGSSTLCSLNVNKVSRLFGHD